MSTNLLTLGLCYFKSGMFMSIPDQCKNALRHTADIFPEFKSQKRALAHTSVGRGLPSVHKALDTISSTI